MANTLRNSCPAMFVLGAAIGQHGVVIDVREGVNGNIQPVNVVPAVTTSVQHCMTGPLPLPVLSSFVSVEVNYSVPDFGIQLDIKVPESPTDVLLTLCGLFPVCPVPVIDLCGPSVVQQYDYGSLRANLSAYCVAAGGGFSGGANYTRIAVGSWTMNDTVEITSPFAQVIELPIHIHGDVLAAESFGDPNQTWGKAELEIIGTALGQPIDRGVCVESTTVIPTTAQIQVTDYVPIAVPAGVSTHTISLTSRSRVETRAQSAGLFGTITGAATAAVDAPNSIRVGRFRAAGGGALPAGTRVRGLLSGVAYEGFVPVPAPFRLVPGCGANQAVLYPTNPGAPVPGVIAAAERATQITSGTSILYAGLEGTTPFGCGLRPGSAGPSRLQPDRVDDQPDRQRPVIVHGAGSQHPDDQGPPVAAAGRERCHRRFPARPFDRVGGRARLMHPAARWRRPAKGR